MKINTPLLIDGGLSTYLETKGVDLNHHLWTARLIDTDPDSIIDAHMAYLEAGSNCITTSTYQATLPGFIASGHSKRKAKEKPIFPRYSSDPKVPRLLLLNQHHSDDSHSH